jgi:hypothetical protein
MSQYLFYKKNNRRLKFDDTVFISFIGEKEMRHGYRGGEGHDFFLLIIPLIYPIFISYIFIQQNPIFLYIFAKSGLTPCACLEAR